jgi:hypothetical protein
VKLGALRTGHGRDRALDRVPAREGQRGQSLTELALILPVLLLLTVVALDFGRVYLGYVNIQNMARIAANYAANNPLAWGATPDAVVQERYDHQVLQDATATNCALPVAGGNPVIPDPVFTDVDGDGSAVGLGDRVGVALTCEFTVVTPLIANILGGTVRVTAESDFPIKAGMTAVVIPVAAGGGGGGTTVPPVASFMINGDPALEAVAGDDVHFDYEGSSVTLYFSDTSSLGVTSSWFFDDGSPDSTEPNPTHTFTCALALCEYRVVLTSGNPYGTSTAHMHLWMTAGGNYDFSADRTVIVAGESVTFTDLSVHGVLPASTQYTWTFGDGSAPEITTSPSITHTYVSASGSPFSVGLVIDYTAPDSSHTVPTKVAYITVNPGYCKVPSLTGIKFNAAPAIWQAGYVSPVDGLTHAFTGTVKRASGAPNGNFTITAQSIAAGTNATAVCTSDVYVSQP